MYITPELFCSNTTYERPAFPRHTWDGMADTHHMAGLGKRKRQTESDLDKKIASTGSSPSSSPSGKSSLKLQSHSSLPLADTERTHSISVATPTYVDNERRPVKQTRRLNPKLSKQASHLMEVELTPTTPQRDTDTHGASTTLDLRPCHSCRSVPKRKQDLENYMDCRHCEGRACYICARECIACTKAICNKCIVEVGEEGDSWCLQCHQRQINS